MSHTFYQIKQNIPVKKKFYRYLRVVFSISALVFSAASFQQAFAQIAPSLGAAQNFAVLGATTITSAGLSTVYGSVGVSPGSSVTGFPPALISNGQIYTGAGSLAEPAESSALDAYNDLKGQASPPSNNLSGKILGQSPGAITLGPGVYAFNTSAQLNSTLTLDDGGNADAVFIFQIGTTLTTAAGAQVLMTGGGRGKNVYWQVGTSATLGAATIFRGSIISNTSITFGTGASTTGRAFALNGAVTLDFSAVNAVGYLTTWTGAAGTSNWFTQENWDEGVPDTTVDSYIPTSLEAGRVFPIIDTGTAAVNNMTIQEDASVIVVNSIFQINGAIINKGTMDASQGAIQMTGFTSQTIAANTFTYNTIKNLILNNNVTLAGQDTITGTLSFGNNNDKTFNTGGLLTLKSTAAGTARVADLTNGGANMGNNISGSVMIERFIPAHYAWNLLTSPTISTEKQTIKEAWQEGVNNTTTNYAENKNPLPGYGTHIPGPAVPDSGFDALNNSNGFGFITKYSNSLNTWIPLTSSNSAVNKDAGYLVYVSGDRSTNINQANNSASVSTVLRSTGQLHNGDQSDSVAASGFTVIRNPFASAIDLNNVSKVNSTNVQDNFYVWDPQITGTNNVGGFVNISWNNLSNTYDITPSGSSEMNQYVQSGSAFLTRTIDGASPGTLIVKETDKTTKGYGIVINPADSLTEKLTTTLYSYSPANNNVVDGTLNSYGTIFSNAVDYNDAVKLKNLAENLSTRRNGTLLTVERKKFIGLTDTIFFNMLQMKNKQYTFQFVAQKLNHPGLEAVLEDSYLNSTTPIALNGSTSVDFYVIGVEASSAPDRFRIVFRPAAILPVTFSSAKAYQKFNDVEVEWIVENEFNIKQYDIERSPDGRQFTKANTITAKGNNNNASAYSWLDQTTFKGNNFYRIKSVDVNGLFKFSSVMKVQMGVDKPGIKLKTNIILDNTISFQMNNTPSGVYQVSITNNSGQLLYRNRIEHQDGSSTENIKLRRNYTPGIYHLKIIKPDLTSIIMKLFIK